MVYCDEAVMDWLCCDSVVQHNAIGKTAILWCDCWKIVMEDCERAVTVLKQGYGDL